MTFESERLKKESHTQVGSIEGDIELHVTARSESCTNNQYNCLICRKAYKSKSSLRKHEKIKHKEKNESCSEEGLFKREIQSDVTGHPKSKQYGYLICSKTYTSKDSLKRHRKNDHGEMKYVRFVRRLSACRG